LNTPSPKRISAEEYVALACAWDPSLPFERVTVAGDVNLGKIQHGSSVKFLPPATIEGDLIASNLDLSLQEVHCDIGGDVLIASQSFRHFAGNFVSGEFVAEGCLALDFLAGEFGKNVNLARSGIRDLGRNFKCSGNLDVTGCRSLRAINSVVGGSLTAKLSALENFGDHCAISGDVDISHCAQLRHLGKIGSPKNVIARTAALESVSPNFFCRGSLTLQLCHCLETVSGVCGGSASIIQSTLSQIKKFTCGDSLSIRHCSELKTIEASVAQDVDLSDCESLTRLSSACRLSGVLRIGGGVALKDISGHFKAEVNLSSLENLKEIPSKFSCERDLLIRNCRNLEKICGNIGGNLMLNGSQSVEHISEECQVAGSMIVSDDRPTGDLPKFPPRMVFSGKIPKDLKIQRVPVDIVTKPSFVLGGDLAASSCRSVALSGLVSGSVFLENTFVDPMGADLEISKDLRIAHCAGPSKVNCQISGDASFVDSSIEETGVAFHAKGAVIFENCTWLKKVNGNFEGGVEFTDPKNNNRESNMPLPPPSRLSQTMKNLTPTISSRSLSTSLGVARSAKVTRSSTPSTPVRPPPLPRSL